MDYKEENGMLLCTKSALHTPCLLDQTIERYFGQYLKDSPVPEEPDKYGKGLMITRFNEIHEGWYEHNEPNGYGRLIQAHGFYIGMFKNSRFEGYGKYFYNDGRIYEGEFLDHKYHGWGTFFEIDGEKYIGDFKKGIKEGVGTYEYRDGSKYEGLWKNGKRHGKGTFTKSNK